MSRIFDTKTYNISEFLKWQEAKELDLSPKFQRNSVWNDQAKSYLIDSILRGLPIPPVFIRQTVDVKASKIYREVIDGQQRLRTVIEFYTGKFVIRGPFAEKNYRGKHYSELSDELKELFLEYEIATQIVKSQPDGVIYDMFARLNSNNMVLNSQEIRNAKYWGLFKGLVYELGRDFKNNGIDWKIFKDKDLSRMKDYELINSLVIYLMDGVKTETAKVINDYYRNYDKKLDNINTIMNRFMRIIDFISKVYENGYELTVFNRPRYFYTLFVCIDKYYNENKAMPNIKVFISNLSVLEKALKSTEDNKKIPNLLKIKEYHLIRTTSVSERNQRISAVYKVLF